MQKNIFTSFLGVCVFSVSSFLMGMDQTQEIPHLPLELWEKIAHEGANARTFGNVRETCADNSYMRINVLPEDAQIKHLLWIARKDPNQFDTTFSSQSDDQYLNISANLGRAGYDIMPIAEAYKDEPKKHIGYFNGREKAEPTTFLASCTDESCSKQEKRIIVDLFAANPTNILKLKKFNPNWFHTILSHDVDGNNGCKFYKNILYYGSAFSHINEKDGANTLPLEYIASMNNHEQSVKLAKVCEFNGMKLMSGRALTCAVQQRNVPMVQFLLGHKRDVTDEQLLEAMTCAADQYSNDALYDYADEMDNLIIITKSLQCASGDRPDTWDISDLLTKLLSGISQ